MNKIVETLTRENIASILETGELVFTEEEGHFLNKYAPLTFSGKPLEEMIELPAALMEINQMVADIMFKIDISMYRLKEPTNLLKEKARVLNPIFRAFSLKEINDFILPHETVYKLKTGCLELLEIIGEDITEQVQCWDEQRFTLTNRFEKERKELELLFGDVPIAVYGSALNGDNPHDIDMMVMPKELSSKTYQKMIGKFDEQRVPPLTFMFVPQQFLKGIALADSGAYHFNLNKMAFINRKIALPIINEDYSHKLGFYDTAQQYIRLRRALVQGAIDSSIAVLPRVNNLLKIPKFVFMKLGQEGRDKPIIKNYDYLPNRDEYVHNLIEANLECNRLLRGYR